MSKKRVYFVLLFCSLFMSLFLLTSLHMTAQESSKEPYSVTTHTIQIGGKPLSYTATVGTIPLKEDNGKLLANIFFIAYTRDGITDKSRRPLLFSFNGGPGSSSVWMHMGFLGPRRVLVDDEGFAFQPPYSLIDNEYSILDVSDVVFIDPVGTGFSRPAEGVMNAAGFGAGEGVGDFGDFIHAAKDSGEGFASADG